MTNDAVSDIQELNLTPTIMVFLTSYRLGDHPYITSANGLGGCGQQNCKWTGGVWSAKLQFFLTFSTIYAKVEWVSGSEKVQNDADVI